MDSTEFPMHMTAEAAANMAANHGDETIELVLPGWALPALVDMLEKRNCVMVKGPDDYQEDGLVWYFLSPVNL